MNLKDKLSKKNLKIKDFDGILIGSGIKIGSWTKEAKKFVNENKKTLKQKEDLLGVYVSCGDAMNPNKYEEARKKYIDPILKKHDLSPALKQAFGGVLDLSENSNLGFLNKKMMELASKEDPTIIKGKRNDFRNWDQIFEFAKDFATCFEH
ncbi:MAG: flavodoxin domain-containing protein [Promethearchaeota archaeon]